MLQQVVLLACMVLCHGINARGIGMQHDIDLITEIQDGHLSSLHLERYKRNIIDPEPTPDPHEKHGEFIPVGHTAKIHCLPDGTQNNYRHPRYEWMDGANRPLESARFIKISNGTLQISDVQPEDSDNYTCALRYSEADDTPIRTTFPHQFWTFTMPISKIVATFLYTRIPANPQAKLCTAKIGRIKSKQLQDVLCGDYTSGGCPYRVRAQCDFIGEGEKKKPTDVNIQIYTATGRFKSPPCIATCVMNATEEQLVRNFGKVEALYKAEKVVHPLVTDTKDVLRFISTKYSYSMKHTCQGGYRAFTIVCLPCPPGTFSTPGSKHCIMCPKNHYQNKYAMEECFKCPKDKITHDYGTKSVEDCEEKGEIVVTLDIDQPKTRKLAVMSGWLTLGLLLICGILIVLKLMMDQKQKREKELEDDPDIKDLHDEIRKSHTYSSIGSRCSEMTPNSKSIGDTPSVQIGSRLNDRHSISQQTLDKKTKTKKYQTERSGKSVDRKHRSRSSLKSDKDHKKRAASVDSAPTTQAPSVPARPQATTRQSRKTDDPYIVPRGTRGSEKANIKKTLPQRSSKPPPSPIKTTSPDRSSKRNSQKSEHDESLYYTPQATEQRREPMDESLYATPPEGRIRHSIRSDSISPERPIMRESSRRASGMNRVMLANVHSLPPTINPKSFPLYESLRSSFSEPPDVPDVPDVVTDYQEPDWVSVSTRESGGSLTLGFSTRLDPDNAADNVTSTSKFDADTGDRSPTPLPPSPPPIIETDTGTRSSTPPPPPMKLESSEPVNDDKDDNDYLSLPPTLPSIAQVESEPASETKDDEQKPENTTPEEPKVAE